jgi:hypothetical protein
MNGMRIWIGMMLAGCAAAAYPQAVPAPAAGSAAAVGQATATQGATEVEKKAADDANSRAPASSAGRRRNDPGYAPPLNIRMKDEGIALPKCVRESREGEPCKDGEAPAR